MSHHNPWDQGKDRPNDTPPRRDFMQSRRRGMAFRYGSIGFAILLLVGGLALAFPAVSPDGPALVKAVLILLVVAGSWSLFRRIAVGDIVKMIAIWAVIITGISAIYLVTQDDEPGFFASVSSAEQREFDGAYIVRKARDGHFWLKTEVNGVPLKMMVDTGASHIVLTKEDARRVGFDLETLTFDLRAKTANGSVRFARAEVDSFKLGHTISHAVPVTINNGDMPGSLLGMSVLDRFSSVEFRKSELILRP